MKKFTFLLTALLFCGLLNAQTSKGNFVMGFHNFNPGPLASFGTPYNWFPQTNALGISFGSSKSKNDGNVSDYKVNNTVVGLSLNSHYFVDDNLGLGLTASFSSTSSVEKGTGDDSKTSSTILLIGPAIRYYFDTGEKSKFWLKGGTSFGSISSKYDGQKSDPTSISQFEGGAGISIFPVSAVSFDLGIGYSVLSGKAKEANKGTKAINSNLTFDIGVSVFL